MENRIKLNNGVEMPRIGYWVYQISPSQTERCVRDALAVGYRSIDTAQCYYNEAEVGQAVRSADIPRDEVFITTKLWGGRGYASKTKMNPTGVPERNCESSSFFVCESR